MTYSTTFRMLDIRVLPGPVRILKEGELVKGCPDIAGCPRVGVVVPGATNLAGRLENGEGNTFLLQLRSNTESTETSAHNKGIVLFNPIHFLSFGAPKPIEDGSKNQGKEKEDDWQREQSGKQGNHCQYEEEGKKFRHLGPCGVIDGWKKEKKIKKKMKKKKTREKK